MLRTPGRSTAREWRWNRAWKLCRGVHLPSRVSCEDSPRAAVKPLSSQKFVHFAKLATSSQVQGKGVTARGGLQEAGDRTARRGTRTAEQAHCPRTRWHNTAKSGEPGER